MRRTIKIQCTHDGCKEFRFYEYHSAKELAESSAFKNRDTYKCCRHSDESRVLTPERTKTEWLSEPCEQNHIGKYFGGMGVLIGNGYYLEADDVPVGTRLKITCELILPE